jgi:hypothetical protein
MKLHEIVWKCKTHDDIKVQPARVLHMEFVDRFISGINFYKKKKLFIQICCIEYIAIYLKAEYKFPTAAMLL